jgi:hypothetical protein
MKYKAHTHHLYHDFIQWEEAHHEVIRAALTALFFAFIITMLLMLTNLY